jgi:hypothetical protein
VPDRKSLFSKIRFSFFDGEAVQKLIQYNKYPGFSGAQGN